ncbi:MAG TPA: GNAT family N-acetyltransferase [Burkholderiales bacterium]|jgi:putative acetyltransferase|nr:GNAT family N-acetyltransferase [Burkholderiales bacterium]
MPAAFSSITQAHPHDLPRLFEVWESSARATHAFLTAAEIDSLIPLVKAELANFSPIHCLRDDDGQVIAMLGVAASSIEMLFVHASHRSQGAGRTLVDFAVRELRADRVDVNEQNGAAIGFYQHMGFRQAGRSPLDSAGRPFPILHMALPKPAAGPASARPGARSR